MFTHIDENGDANMVDVSKKNDTLREAIAQGSILLNKEIINAIVGNTNKKGDVLSTSRLAGIQAAKRTSDLIPLAHNLNLTKIEIEFSIDDENNMIHCEGLVRFKLCANGIKSEVLFAAWIPASLDVDNTLPFLLLFSTIALIISSLSSIDPCAIASLKLSFFFETSTMLASPFSSI